MAKKCAICGAEVNMLQSQKLVDGNYICRPTCKKLGMNILEYQYSDLAKVKAHNEQVKRGAEMWDYFFVPRMKSGSLKNFRKSIFVAEDLGLLALKRNRYKFLFWGKTEQFCVYRIADLYVCDVEVRSSSGKNKNSKTYHVNFYFRNVEGLTRFSIQFNRKLSYKIANYFDSLLGFETRNRWSRQADSIKGTFDMVKSAISGDLNLDPATMHSDAAYEEFAKKSGSLREGGNRADWIKKSDAAMQEFSSFIR